MAVAIGQMQVEQRQVIAVLHQKCEGLSGRNGGVDGLHMLSKQKTGAFQIAWLILDDQHSDR